MVNSNGHKGVQFHTPTGRIICLKIHQDRMTVVACIQVSVCIEITFQVTFRYFMWKVGPKLYMFYILYCFGSKIVTKKKKKKKRRHAILDQSYKDMF